MSEIRHQGRLSNQPNSVQSNKTHPKSTEKKTRTNNQTKKKKNEEKQE